MRSLTVKLAVALLAVGLTGAVLVGVIARWVTLRQFDTLAREQAQISFAEDVTEYYETHGSWRGVEEHIRWEAQNPPPPPGEVPPPVLVLVDSRGVVVVAASGHRRGDQVSSSALAQGVAVEVDGEVVGTVLDSDDAPPFDPREERYLARNNQALLYASLGATVIALILGVLLARSLTRPLRELTSATRALAKGQLDQQVPLRSRDELGELAAAFNQMSSDLARANELRRQMTADVAHDLRTPLAVISGYIEALRDGALQPSPERFEVLYNEVQHLNRLVDDLRTLSLADAGELTLNRQPVTPQVLLEQSAAAHRHGANQRNVALLVESDPHLPEAYVDPDRMAQVLGNLLGNALRHTPEAGRITLAAYERAGNLHLVVRDTGEGIEAAALHRVFDRFYRGDEAREGNGGQSGLGLSIAKSLVELHGGTITVESVLGEGTTFRIVLPYSAAPK